MNTISGAPTRDPDELITLLSYRDERIRILEDALRVVGGEATDMTYSHPRTLLHDTEAFERIRAAALYAIAPGLAPRTNVQES